MIRSGDGGATAGRVAAAAPRGSRQRRPGGRGGSGSGASPWWMPHPERCPPSREPRPPPQGGGGSNLRRGDPQPLPPPQRPARGSGEAGWKGKMEGELQRLAGELLLQPLGWSAAGSVRPGRSGRAEKPGAEAALPSGMRRGGSRAPLGGGRRGGAEPRLRAAAARSCRSPPHHLPPRRRLPAQPQAAPGSALRQERNRARGPAAADSSRHAPAGTPEGAGRGGEGRERRGAGERVAPTRAGEEWASSWVQSPEKPR